jgi:hypothetical protein
VDCKTKVESVHNGLFDVALGLGGVESITTNKEVSLDLQLLIVTDTLYVPACQVDAFVIVTVEPVVPVEIPGPDHK